MKDFPVLKVVLYGIFHDRRVAPVDLSGVFVDFLDHPRDVVRGIDDVVVYEEGVVSKTAENLPAISQVLTEYGLDVWFSDQELGYLLIPVTVYCNQVHLFMDRLESLGGDIGPPRERRHLGYS